MLAYKTLNDLKQKIIYRQHFVLRKSILQTLCLSICFSRIRKSAEHKFFAADGKLSFLRKKRVCLFQRFQLSFSLRLFSIAPIKKLPTKVSVSFSFSSCRRKSKADFLSPIPSQLQTIFFMIVVQLQKEGSIEKVCVNLTLQFTQMSAYLSNV